MIRRVGLGLLTAAAFAASLESLRVGRLGDFGDVTFLLATVALGFGFLTTGRAGHLGPYLRVILASAMFAIAALVGTLATYSRGGGSLLNLARFATATMVLPFAVAILRPSSAEARRLAWAYVLGCTLSAAVSFVEVDPMIGRSRGLSSHPNHLGFSAALAIPLAFVLWNRTAGRIRYLAMLCLPVLLWGISRSGSRAGIVALLAGSAAVLVLTRRYRALLAEAVAVVLLGLVLVTGLYTPPENSAVDRLVRQSPSTERANEGREELAEAAIDRIDRSVVTGSGFADAPHTQGHSLYLEALDVGGILGVLGFSAMIWAIVRTLWRRRALPVVAGALASYLAYLVGGLVQPTLWNLWLWFPIVIGLAAAAAASPRSRTAARSPARGTYGPVGRAHDEQVLA